MSKIKLPILTCLLSTTIALAPYPAMAQEFSETGALAFNSRGDFQGMQAYCQQWLKIAPDNWYANDYMACALYQMKNYDASIPYFENALRINPNTAYTYKQLALAEGYGGRFDKMLAVMHFGEQRVSTQFDYEMWRWYGQWFQVWNDWDSSVNAWQHAYDMKPSPEAKADLAGAYYGKGHFEALAQKLDEAEVSLKKAVALGAPNAQTCLAATIHYHYVDKPKWQAEAHKAYLDYCEYLRKHPPPPIRNRSLDLNQLEYRTRVFEAGHPGEIGHY